MKVGDKVWVMWGGEWAKAVVVPERGVPNRRGTMCVVFEPFMEDVYRVSKAWVKERND